LGHKANSNEAHASNTIVDHFRYLLAKLKHDNQNSNHHPETQSDDKHKAIAKAKEITKALNAYQVEDDVLVALAPGRNGIKS
jgi:hypothetical protein